MKTLSHIHTPLHCSTKRECRRSTPSVLHAFATAFAMCCPPSSIHSICYVRSALFLFLARFIDRGVGTCVENTAHPLAFARTRVSKTLALPLRRICSLHFIACTCRQFARSLSLSLSLSLCLARSSTMATTQPLVYACVCVDFYSLSECLGCCSFNFLLFALQLRVDSTGVSEYVCVHTSVCAMFSSNSN